MSALRGKDDSFRMRLDVGPSQRLPHRFVAVKALTLYQTFIHICFAFTFILLIINWLTCFQNHNLEPIEDKSKMPEVSRWGHQGHGVDVNLFNLTGIHKKELLDGLKRFGYNIFVGDRIPLRRTLPDKQSPVCRSLWTKSKSTVSVIIVYHDEAWSTLMRTVYSVLDRSESSLLREVIIVDDASSHKKVKATVLKNYLAMSPQVKVIQLDTRHGISGARIVGAQNAAGDILVFLHARCECNHGWLRPLVGRLEENSKTIAVPNRDVISPLTFEYKMVDSVQDINVAGFTWNLMKKRKQPNYVYTDEESPIPTPVIPDGLMAITKTFFWTLGGDTPWQEELHGYLKITDREDDSSVDDIHFSFKSWMCGGSIEIVPCSRVGLVIQKLSPLEIVINQEMNNRKRLAVAEVWMDEFKYHVYDRIKNVRTIGSENGLSTYRSTRERLKCHSFSWYLSHVDSSLIAPPSESRKGELIHESANGVYLVLGTVGLQAQLCVWQTRPAVIWYLNNKSLLATENNTCLTVSTGSRKVALRPCDILETVFLADTWSLNNSGRLYHDRTKQCLTVSTSDANVDVEMATCDPTKLSQRWTLSY